MTPPSVVDVFSADQLIEGLASLVVNNLTVRRWLFKIDDQIHGRGVGMLLLYIFTDCTCTIMLQLIVMLLIISSAILGL